MLLACLLAVLCLHFFFKQKTAYEWRISDWSSDVCSSDLIGAINQIAPLLLNIHQTGMREFLQMKGQRVTRNAKLIRQDTGHEPRRASNNKCAESPQSLRMGKSA